MKKKILFLNPNKWGRGITTIWIASHSGVLKRNNCIVELFDSTFYKKWSDFEIDIYDKKFGSKNRKLLHSVKGNESAGKHIFSFEPENQKAIYIDYLLPASEEKNITGCIVFLMGYKIG